MNLMVEVGIVAAFGVGNSPWLKKDFQRPYLLVEKTFYENFYVKSFNSSRTMAKNLNTLNPKTALWDVAFGYRYKFNNEIFDISIGHASEHEVGKVDALTESFDYIKVSYRIETELK